MDKLTGSWNCGQIQIVKRRNFGKSLIFLRANIWLNKAKCRKNIRLVSNAGLEATELPIENSQTPRPVAEKGWVMRKLMTAVFLTALFGCGGNEVAGGSTTTNGDPTSGNVDNGGANGDGTRSISQKLVIAPTLPDDVGDVKNVVPVAYDSTGKAVRGNACGTETPCQVTVTEPGVYDVTFDNDPLRLYEAATVDISDNSAATPKIPNWGYETHSNMPGDKPCIDNQGSSTLIGIGIDHDTKKIAMGIQGIFPRLFVTGNTFHGDDGNGEVVTEGKVVPLAGGGFTITLHDNFAAGDGIEIITCPPQE